MIQSFNKIFQIGFNKCGTTSLNDFFNKNGISSVHYKHCGKEIALIMMNNLIKGSKMLDGLEKYDAFTDMESVENNIFIYLTHYKELDRQYPNSKFILNTRNIDDWITSRINHSGYLLQFQKNLSLTEEEVIDYWKKSWYKHLADVKDYFHDRPNDLLIFDIETESDKLFSFMETLCDIKERKFEKANCSYDIFSEEAYEHMKKFFGESMSDAAILDAIRRAWDDVGGILPELIFYNKAFNAEGYINKNPDIKDTVYVQFPFVHWILYGAKEGRKFC